MAPSLAALQNPVMINYTLEGPKWISKIVTWSFSTLSNSAFSGLIIGAYRNSIRAAAAQWTALANVTLQEIVADPPEVDIVIGWSSFGGMQIGETNYSYQVGSNPGFQRGVVIRIEDPTILSLDPLDDAFYQGTSTTLRQIALHEFGHALGLGLSTDPYSVMNIRLGPNNININESDLAGIAALYGSETNTGMIIPSSSDLDVVVLNKNTIGVYRFFNIHDGTQFLTSSVHEMNGIFSTRSDLKFEGLSVGAIASAANDPNTCPIYRFFNTANGTHFLTINESEAAAVSALRPDLVSEQISFSEHVMPQAGDVAVYRFFDTHEGTQFLTADDGERNSIASNRADLIYEGIAFYAPAIS